MKAMFVQERLLPGAIRSGARSLWGQHTHNLWFREGGYLRVLGRSNSQSYAAQSGIATNNPQAMETNPVVTAFFLPPPDEAAFLLKLVSQNTQTSDCTCSNQEQGDTCGFWHGYLPSPEWHGDQESNSRGDKQFCHGFLSLLINPVNYPLHPHSSDFLVRKHEPLPVSKAILVPGF